MFYAAAGGAVVAYSGRTSTIDQTGGTRRAGVCTTTSWMPHWADQSIGLPHGSVPVFQACELLQWRPPAIGARSR